MFASVCFQDLKEKKLVEEKENGKDAATNGKVSAIAAAAAALCTESDIFNHFCIFQENEENGEPEVDDEEDEEVDEEEEEDDGEGSLKAYLPLKKKKELLLVFLTFQLLSCR